MLKKKSTKNIRKREENRNKLQSSFVLSLSISSSHGATFNRVDFALLLQQTHVVHSRLNKGSQMLQAERERVGVRDPNNKISNADTMI